MTAKYSIVLKFWNTPQEIECVDYVHSMNKFTKRTYVEFIDTKGRLWQVPEDDCIIVRNVPDNDDKEYFERIKKETEEFRLKAMQIDNIPNTYV